MNRYDRARNHAVYGNEKALIAHAKQEVFSIDDELEQYELLISKLELPSNSLLLLTPEFWSGWADAAAHDWKYYEPIKEIDWPVYAEVLLENLRNNTEVTDVAIKQNFSVFPSKSIFTKLSGLFGGSNKNGK